MILPHCGSIREKMKTQILLKHKAPVSIIGFLLLMIATLIGCKVLPNVNRVMGLDAVRLTLDDLYEIGLRKSNRIGGHRTGGPIKQLSVIGGFRQGTSGDLDIQYWLFDSASTAKKAAEARWTWTFAAMPNFHPEPNSKDVIGDATWRNIHTNRKKWEDGLTDIYFVKHNLLVSVRTAGHASNRLQNARDIARNIETKIEAILSQK